MLDWKQPRFIWMCLAKKKQTPPNAWEKMTATIAAIIKMVVQFRVLKAFLQVHLGPMAMKSNWLSVAVPEVSFVQIPVEVVLTEVQVAIRFIPD